MNIFNTAGIIENTSIRYCVSWPGDETTDHNAGFEKDRKSQKTLLHGAGVEGWRMGAAADGGGGGDGVLAGAARGFCVG